MRPQPPLPLLPPPAAAHLTDTEDRICLSEAALQARADTQLLDDVTPYWDPLLRRSASHRLEFFTELRRIGLLQFTTVARAFVGVLFVAKKGGWLRMVVEGRSPSACHARPPHCPLGLMGAIGQVDPSPDALKLYGINPDDVDMRSSGLDLMDGFYQFKHDPLIS